MSDSYAVVIPYFNEIDYLGRTIRSWLDQTRLPEQLILVDNASTDGSEALCRQLLADCHDIEVVYAQQPQPGRVHALDLGSQYVRCDVVAFCDADTYYPPHYLQLCASVFESAPSNVVAVMAKDIYHEPERLAGRLNRWGYYLLSRVLTAHTFTGGCGQTLRTDALRRSGGYSTALWDYTMEDHELMCRIFKVGRSLYHPNLWCQPSQRRTTRSATHWSLYERAVYFLTQPFCGDWYFEKFLAPRFARRQMYQAKLRERAW